MVTKGADQDNGDRLTQWVQQQYTGASGPARRKSTVPAGTRFALYERMTTVEFFDELLTMVAGQLRASTPST